MKIKIKHPYFWTSILTIGIALFISLFILPTEPCIRITGMVLQLLGVSSVIVGITETRKLFGEPSIFEIAMHYIRVTFNIPKKLNIRIDNFNETESMKVRATTRHIPPGLNPTLKDRIFSLEQNFKIITGELNNLHKEKDIEIKNVLDLIKNEIQERNKDFDKLHKEIKESSTGGIHISLLGATWLFFGVILTSLAPELAKLLY